ncbi:ABC transporter ATP-binding protein [Marinomonas primoryensis]|jgi:iron(III) transport system ATP-binding protein|uniref:ABC transporter ATP-binding protein n=1 Tax=Marinomonas primoryensis TaxID=178399 RepID=UPI003704AC96
MSQDSSVIFKNVVKAFNDTHVVKSINFQVDSGKLVTLLGPSGCGKTTTLRMIAGLELPTSGEIYISGKEVSKVSASGRNVGMVFQSYALFPHMTVLQNVCYGLSNQKSKKEEMFEKAEKALATVGLSHFKERYPSELSGGQQQRVAIARSIVIQPDVLLFDEPLSNLDAKLRRQVRQDIRDLQQEIGVTAIYVTHDQEEALAISDDIIVMNDGEISQIGSPNNLYKHPENTFVAQFIGDANKLTGNIVDNAENRVFKINEHCLFTYQGDKTVGKYDVFIRPNALKFVNSESPSDISFPAKIKKSIYLGSHTEYQLVTPWGDSLFMIDYSFDEPLANQTKIFISIDARGVSIV